MELNYLTIKQARNGLKKKKFSAVELTKACLAQIEKYDKKINAFITVNREEVLLEAKKADKIMARQARPLKGIPIAVKDNFLTKGIKTTAGSKVLDNYMPQYESTVTGRLKSAGAIIIGKTNMDAWAHGSSTETSNYGPTKNPWDISKLPGGSSGGSSAAIAANMCVGAIGSETAGSIRQPAAWCGATGFKPTYGRVSRYGVIAMASSTDSPGPITKTAQDAAILLSVICGKDNKDATTINKKLDIGEIGEFREIREIRIGVIKDYFLKDAEKEVNEKTLAAIEILKKKGVKVKEISLLNPKYAIADYTIIQRSEVSSNLARYDGIRYGNKRICFGAEAKRRIMFGTYALSAGYYDAYYKKAQKVRTIIVEDFQKAFDKVDLLIAPTSPCAALPVGSTKGQSMFGEMQDILVEASSMAGLPGISLPCGFSKAGLPIGMQIIGPQFNEELLFQIGHYYQQLTDWHKQKPAICT